MSSTNFTAKQKAVDIKLFSISANIENIKSLIIHPASIRCQQMSDAELVAKRVNKGLIRLSRRTEDRKNLKSCCLSRIFTELQV
ncbi:PLP-dependent transferase [Flavobacterium granuli]|uniref:O-acetylhomoserine/O-acetylserine sulfhydrylase-like pyridoxal-dependent enzyme n=1 Tax=Flavobacterium granuli TaxID=280093 RepID=A0ABU1S6S3_9FLAO|nr:PLP-dependent transferase [Flavobacterium granuli]MDR6846729.1 O-acetylhomoserine/O-acetylserine sulfhydrylase-like pyridoxal-dependent enzyme [Flavobacterium granuli]